MKEAEQERAIRQQQVFVDAHLLGQIELRADAAILESFPIPAKHAFASS